MCFYLWIEHKSKKKNMADENLTKISFDNNGLEYPLYLRTGTSDFMFSNNSKSNQVIIN